MFSTVNSLDMFTELNRGAIILVNTSENFVKDASPLFGRYMIARVMADAFERASTPREDRRPTLLIVEEAAPYFDDTFDKLLTRVRQFKLGVVIAFQHMEQASDGLRSAIAWRAGGGREGRGSKHSLPLSQSSGAVRGKMDARN